MFKKWDIIEIKLNETMGDIFGADVIFAFQNNTLKHFFHEFQGLCGRIDMTTIHVSKWRTRHFAELRILLASASRSLIINIVYNIVRIILWI